tara:strand:- start:1134 stop:1865 length:732 start_codon:yes stop_codon:yes gene_type:complete
MKNNTPNHIAIIMDGNGRWAKSNSKSRLMGHKKGVESVREIIDCSKDIGVKSLTLYTFSKDNWQRPKNEVLGLMDLLYFTLKNEMNTFKKNGLRVTYIGDISSFPNKVIKIIEETVNATKDNTILNLNLALGYSSRQEIINIVKIISKKVYSNQIKLEDIDTTMFSNALDENINIGDPDLLIRTGGELRISDFLLWQIAYSEIFFSSKYWPDFDRDEYMKAILNFRNTERRFGKISEQINNNE